MNRTLLSPLLPPSPVLAVSMTDLLDVHEGGEEAWDPCPGMQSVGTRAGQGQWLNCVQCSLHQEIELGQGLTSLY